MKKYLFNSAVIPTASFGRYRYTAATVEDLRAFVQTWAVDSRIGYQSTIDQIEAWTGQRFAISHEPSPMYPGDEAFVVRLKYRPRGRTQWYQPQDPSAEDWELGHLIREADD